jgi:hypothetical protein
MAFSNAEKQARWRAKRNAAALNAPDAVEMAFMVEVERWERGELSDSERQDLGKKLADTAMDYLWRSQRLAKMATKVNGPKF